MFVCIYERYDDDDKDGYIDRTSHFGQKGMLQGGADGDSLAGAELQEAREEIQGIRVRAWIASAQFLLARNKFVK